MVFLLTASHLPQNQRSSRRINISEFFLLFLFPSHPPFHLSIRHKLTEDEFFFVDPDAKLSKVAPEGWKDDPKKKKSDVPFNLFLRIKFFLDDVNLIQ